MILEEESKCFLLERSQQYFRISVFVIKPFHSGLYTIVCSWELVLWFSLQTPQHLYIASKISLGHGRTLNFKQCTAKEIKNSHYFLSMFFCPRPFEIKHKFSTFSFFTQCLFRVTHEQSGGYKSNHDIFENHLCRTSAPKSNQFLQPKFCLQNDMPLQRIKTNLGNI